MSAAINRRQLLCALAGSALLPLAGPVQAAVVGDSPKLPATTLIDGSVLPAARWQGKVLIVEKFATWCPFCKVQNPKLDKLLRAHRARGLEVLALSIDRNPAEVPKYMQHHGYSFHAAMMTPEWQSVLGDVKGLPVIWVFGRDGRIKQIETGELLDEDIEELSRWL